MKRPERGFLRTLAAPVNPVPTDVSDREVDFRAWHLALRIEQVRYVSFLTAGLYFVYTLFEWLFEPAIVTGELQVLRTLGVGLLLTLVGLMSFRPELRRVTLVMLVLAPVAAIAGNLYLSVLAEPFTTHAPEVYLAIIWTFSVSGMTLRQALLSGTMSLALVVGYTIQFHPVQGVPSLHVLWTLAAFTFGVVGAYLLERRDRKLFSQRRQLQRLAAFDDLTGLWNQRQIRERLAREIDRCNRNGAALAVIMFDLDHFKQINDEFGHMAGDGVLAELGALMRERVRSTDLVGRVGGEEFLIVLPDTEPEQAELVADKLRVAMAEHDFTVGQPMTASFGVAQYRSGDTLDDLLGRADHHLYEAKRAGRDRVAAA